jgi:hypothetical protein
LCQICSIKREHTALEQHAFASRRGYHTKTFLFIFETFQSFLLFLQKSGQPVSQREKRARRRPMASMIYCDVAPKKAAARGNKTTSEQQQTTGRIPFELGRNWKSEHTHIFFVKWRPEK